MEYSSYAYTQNAGDISTHYVHHLLHLPPTPWTHDSAHLPHLSTHGNPSLSTHLPGTRHYLVAEISFVQALWSGSEPTGLIGVTCGTSYKTCSPPSLMSRLYIHIQTAIHMTHTVTRELLPARPISDKIHAREDNSSSPMQVQCK